MGMGSEWQYSVICSLEEVELEMPGAVDVTHRCSRVLTCWITDPRVDRALGRRCLQEMAVRGDVMVGRDYFLDMAELISGSD